MQTRSESEAQVVIRHRYRRRRGINWRKELKLEFVTAVRDVAKESDLSLLSSLMQLINTWHHWNAER